jgi:RNA-binding protein YhbY
MFSGKGGVTHNMLDDIHNHWRRAEAVRIKCLGVATLDMDNICFHLEVIMFYHMLDKIGIYMLEKIGNCALLFCSI